MFTFEKKDGTFKSYKAKKVSAGTSQNGNKYTRFRISNKLDENTYENVSVFYWGDLSFKDDDLVEITKIKSFESKIEEYNGEKRLQTTIFADINVVGTNSTPSKPVEVAGEIDPLEPIDDDFLPF